jgi:hypothetical protein
MFENRALRRIFGPKRDEVEGGWRKLHVEERRNIFSSSNVIIDNEVKKELGRACSIHACEEEYMILVKNPDGKTPLGITRCRS